MDTNKGVVEVTLSKYLNFKSLHQHGQGGNEMLCSSNFSYQTIPWIDIYYR